jgi:hypothetical protein
MKQRQPPIQLNTNHDWTEVENALISACNQLDRTVFGNRTHSNLLSRLRSGFQTLCRHARTAQTFISFIPSDFMCSSVLCGGLKTIFSALEKTGNHRDEIQKALAELPEILDETALRMRVHQHSEELHKRSEKLFSAVLRVMSHILHWLCEKSMSPSPTPSQIDRGV